MANDMAVDDDCSAQVSTSAVPLLLDLRDRAKALLLELETFREHLRTIRQEGQVELAHFRGTVQSELGMLDRLSKKPDNESTIHIARSSNLPFLETIWSTAKKSKNLISLQKRVYYNSPHKSLSQSMHHVSLGDEKPNQTGKKNAAVTVDGMSNYGLVWLKVSLVTNTRLIFDLAKQGWQSEGSEEEEDWVFPDDDEDSDVPLVKTVKEVCLAAKSFRVRTKTPVVHLILPRIRPGEVDEVDNVLDQCRAAGATVFCGEEIDATPTIDSALSSMVSDPITTFSDTLNIDCTMLLAIVSEFSHAKVSKEPWFHKALQRQVEIEGNENLLPSLLYPALGRHRLVCTKEAAKRMREIVETIGTPSEKARTVILLGDDQEKSHDQLIKDMQQWSAYDVPSDLQLPILVVDQNDKDCQSTLPPEANSVRAHMTAINQSVFLYGWATRSTTITSNRTVVNQIKSDLEKFENLDEGVFPSIWLCPTARSLVGKEKRGAKKDEQDRPKKTGVWPLPDPLRREQQRRHGLDVLSSREGREVEDLRPDGYPCEEILEAKNAARRRVENGGCM